MGDNLRGISKRGKKSQLKRTKAKVKRTKLNKEKTIKKLRDLRVSLKG